MRCGFVFAATAALLFASDPAAAGPGDLLISPLRVVLAGRERAVELTLVNKGAESAVYRLSFVERDMAEDGSLIERAAETPASAAALVRFAPREIALAPNAPQTIRLMLRATEQLADGEYRSHLLFAAQPAEDAASIEGPATNATRISIRLTPVYGVTIPIIVRKGALSASASLTNPVLKRDVDGGAILSATLERTGDRSLFGDVEVAAPGGKKPIAVKSGVALYVPNVSRRIEIALDKAQADAVARAGATLRFSEREGAETPASASVVLNAR